MTDEIINRDFTIYNKNNEVMVKFTRCLKTGYELCDWYDDMHEGVAYTIRTDPDGTQVKLTPKDIYQILAYAY